MSEIRNTLIDHILAYEGAVIPTASFTKNSTTGVQPATIQFNDTSTNTPTMWNWSFGDGTWDNETQNATKTYATGGNYSVFLIASNVAGSDQTDVQYVRIYNQTTAILSQYPDVHDAYVPPGVVAIDYFGFTSINVTRWSWWLDNQWYNGTDHAYYNITYDFDSLTHNYTIGLYTSDDGYGESHVNTTYNITEGVSAHFTGTPLTGNAPVSVQFTGAETGGADTWFWVFGDGDTTNNSLQSPLHTYATGGLFNVSLNASHSGSFDWENKTGYVNLTSVLAPVATFTANQTAGATPMAVLFTDASTNTPTTWNLSFGDGTWFNTSNVSLINNTHTYTLAGTYTVNLTVANIAGSNTTVKTGYIVATTLPVAGFSKNRVLVPIPQLLIVNSTSTYAPTMWNYSWGDGQWSNGTANATHRYSRPSLFSVSLTVSNAAGNSTTSQRIWATSGW
jgi:PKD repeat protein